jgi:hypothetical protein
MSTGKWAQAGVPHRGWICIGIEDLGDVDAVCEMCETMSIRYVHTMEHPDYHEALQVGCVCAGNMEQDLVGARRRESEFRKRQSRRSSWLTRPWRTSRAGNDYLNTDGFNVVVFPKGHGWGARVKHQDSERTVISRQPFQTAEQAKLAALDAMLNMKTARTGE